MGTVEINDLALRARKKDKEALTTLVKAFQSEIVGMVKKSSIHANDYSDAVQEILILVMTCVDKYDPLRGDFQNYLRHSVHLYILKFHAREGRKRNREPLCDEWEDTAVYQAQAPDVSDMMRGLPPIQQELILDHYGLAGRREYSINQIAARRGMSNARVKKELAEAVLKMRGNA